MLEVSNLGVFTKDGKEILSGVDFSVSKGETVVLLGPNGAGKSTICTTLMGDPRFKVKGSAKFEKKELLKLTPDKRAKLGIFLSFQNPVEIPGVSTTEMLRTALVKKNKYLPLDTVREEISKNAKKLGQNIWFSERELNIGFSGGEKKKNEIIQMLTLKPKLIILDEIDSGLDLDASDKISKILRDYQKETDCSYLIVTHNMRILKHLAVSKTVILNKGRVYMTGDEKLISRVEKQGFKAIFEEVS